jgi:hypothetical protein
LSLRRGSFPPEEWLEVEDEDEDGDDVEESGMIGVMR